MELILASPTSNRQLTYANHQTTGDLPRQPARHAGARGDALAEAKINIYAITTSDTVDHSVIRMVVSDYRQALHVFEEHGTLVVEDDVLMVEGSNKPGEMARIAHKLAEAKINIEYCYSATPPDAKKGLLILRVSNPAKALKVLNS